MKKRIISTSVVLLTIGITGILSGCGGKSIDISQFIEYDLKGINGKGELIASLKNMDLELEIANKKGIKDIESMKSLAEVIDIETFLSTIEVKTDEDSKNYSNGDEATINVTYDENKAKALGINFVNSTSKFKITDLREGTLVDPFSDEKFNVSTGEGIYFIPEGAYPDVTIKLENNISTTDILSKVKYSIYKLSDDSNNADSLETGAFIGTVSGVDKDDSIVIKADVDEDFYESGYGLSQTEKTFKAKELIGEDVTSLSQIDDAGWKEIEEYTKSLKIKFIDKAGDRGLFSERLQFKGGGANDDLYYFSSAKITDFKLDNIGLYKNTVNIGGDTISELDVFFSLNAKEAGNMLGTNLKDFDHRYGSFRINDLRIKNGTITFDKSESNNEWRSVRGLYGSKKELLESITSEKLDEGEVKFKID